MPQELSNFPAIKPRHPEPRHQNFSKSAGGTNQAAAQKRFRRATYADNPFGSEEFIERARQTRNTTETPLTPVAWIREPNQPC